MHGTLIDSINATLTNTGWVTVLGLNAAVFSDFYVVMTQLSNSPNCVPKGIAETMPKAYRSYSRNIQFGNAWAVSTYQDFMIHALVSTNVDAIKPANDELDILPNPSYGKFNVASVKPIKAIHIYSVSGKLLHVYQNLLETDLTLNLAGNSSGIYIIGVDFTDGETLLRKLVVNQ